MRFAPVILGAGALALSACSGSSSSNKSNSVFQSGTVAVQVQATTVAPVGSPAAVGDSIPFLLREADAGADLNGDGDTLDDVVHILDAQTGAVTNLGLSTDAELVVGEGFFAFQRNEAIEGLDLNSDGDTLDAVLFIHDLIGSVTRSAGLAFGAVHAIGPRVFFEVPEADNGGVDLNGNGSSTDQLFYEHNPATGMTLDTGYLYPGDQFDRRGDTVVFAGPAEMIVYDLLTSSGQTFNIIARGLQSGGDTLAFSVFESDEAADLNGDGDQDDSIVFIFDYPTLFLRNTGIPRDDSVEFAFSTNFVAFSGFMGSEQGVVLVDILNVLAEFVPLRVSSIYGVANQFLLVEDEAAVATDRNGDGDTIDKVATFLNAGLMTTGLELAVVNVLVRGEVLFLSVSEAEQGDTDLNGDGDATDFVLHRFLPATGEVENSRLATGVIGTLGGRFLFLNVSEGAEPLNGDGDTTDAVLHVLDLSNDRIQNLQLAVAQTTELSDVETDAAFSVLINEAEQGADLNQDGDQTDDVLQYVVPQL